MLLIGCDFESDDFELSSEFGRRWIPPQDYAEEVGCRMILALVAVIAVHRTKREVGDLNCCLLDVRRDVSPPVLRIVRD